MKYSLKYILASVIILMTVTVALISCNEDDLPNNGEPIIRYVRVTNPESSDSLLASGFLGDLIAIMGENLGGTRQVWFNDQQASVNPNLITNKTIIVNIPSQAPIDVTNKLRLISADGSEYNYDFVISIPPPVVTSMKLEYVADGGTAYINGLYFFDVTPVVVEFTAAAGGLVKAEVKSTSENQLEVIVPEGAGSGPIRVTTNFGKTNSVLHFRDERNVFLNYDDDGKKPKDSWRTGIFKNVDGLDGNYVAFEGVYSAKQRTEGDGSPYESQFWAKTSGRPEGNLLPGEPGDYDLKFEAKVNDWYASYLNICFAPWDHNGSNAEIWGNDLNARAIWGPWDKDDQSFSTNGEWITVTIPMTEFKWAMGLDSDGYVEYKEMKFNKTVTGSLSLWMLSSTKAKDSPFDFSIDNMRIVPNK